MNDNDLIIVRNRNNGSTGYTLPDSNIRRFFTPGETKKIPLSELRALQYAPGGAYMLDNLLIVENKEALEELNMKVEPEYFYTEEKIKDILYNGSLDAFLDFLDFATQGAIEIAKDLAVKEQIPDSRKREALSKKTGFNIDNAIMVNKILDTEEEETKVEEKKQRRVQVEQESAKTIPARRTAAPEAKITVTPSVPKYNVVSK